MPSIKRMFSSTITSLPKNSSTQINNIIQRLNLERRTENVIGLITNCKKAKYDSNNLEKYNECIDLWLSYMVYPKNI